MVLLFCKETSMLDSGCMETSMLDGQTAGYIEQMVVMSWHEPYLLLPWQKKHSSTPKPNTRSWWSRKKVHHLIASWSTPFEFVLNAIPFPSFSDLQVQSNLPLYSKIHWLPKFASNDHTSLLLSSLYPWTHQVPHMAQGSSQRNTERGHPRTWGNCGCRFLPKVYFHHHSPWYKWRGLHPAWRTLDNKHTYKMCRSICQNWVIFVEKQK